MNTDCASPATVAVPNPKVALRDADGAQGVEAAPLPKIGPRLRGATVGDTTFGPVAEGARRQDVRNNEADVKNKRGDGPSSWIFGSEDEDTRRPGDTSVVTSNQWAPRSSSIRTKRTAWSCGPF